MTAATMPVKTIDHRFCYGHRLLEYDGKCRHLHGHSAKLQLTLRDDTDPEWIDAHRLTMQSWVDESLTGKMILRNDDPALEALEKLGEPVFLVDTNPTTENLAKLMFEAAERIMIPVTAARVWESPRCSAQYTAGAGSTLIAGDNS